MNINYKKTIKLIALLITSLLISFASAQSYSELFMYGTSISIGTAKVIFENGANTTSISSQGVTTAATEVTFDTIPDIEPGQTRTYEQAVNITNGAGATKTINMSLYSITGDFKTDFDYVNVTIIAKNGTALGDSIEIVSSASGTNVTSTGNLGMADLEEWTVRWIIKAKTDATNANSFNITLKVKVD